VSCYDKAVKAKDWLNRQSIYTVEQTAMMPSGISENRHWHVKSAYGDDYWPDGVLIAFAKSKGWKHDSD
jgi:hypothetical protein